MASISSARCLCHQWHFAEKARLAAGQRHHLQGRRRLCGRTYRQLDSLDSLSRNYRFFSQGRDQQLQVPTVEQQEANQERYIRSDKLQVGDFVYKSPHTRQTFDKADMQTRQNEVFVVDSVRAFIKPTLYTLRSLKDKKIPG